MALYWFDLIIALLWGLAVSLLTSQKQQELKNLWRWISCFDTGAQRGPAGKYWWGPHLVTCWEDASWLCTEIQWKILQGFVFMHRYATLPVLAVTNTKLCRFEMHRPDRQPKLEKGSAKLLKCDTMITPPASGFRIFVVSATPENFSYTTCCATFTSRRIQKITTATVQASSDWAQGQQAIAMMPSLSSLIMKCSSYSIETVMTNDIAHTLRKVCIKYLILYIWKQQVQLEFLFFSFFVNCISHLNSLNHFSHKQGQHILTAEQL